MASTLTGKTPKSTYKGLLKTSDNGNISSSLKTISDGEGNESALAVSTTEVSVSGVISATGGNSNQWNAAAAKAAGYTHTQLSPEATWDVTHNLGKRASVSVVDSGENIVIGEVQYLDDNSVRITFSAAFAGKAYFN